VAYVTQKGELKSSSSVHLTDEGLLNITDIYDTVNYHNHSLSNISSLTCDTLQDIHTASIRQLYLTPPSPSPGGDGGVRGGGGASHGQQLLTLQSTDGLVIPSSPSLLFNCETNELMVEKLSVRQEHTSDVNYRHHHHHRIINSTLLQGEIQEMNSISTHLLQLLPSSSSTSTSTSTRSLLVIDGNGIISADSIADSTRGTGPDSLSMEMEMNIIGSHLEVMNLEVSSTKKSVSEMMSLLGTTKDNKVVTGRDFILFSNGELHSPIVVTDKIYTEELYLTLTGGGGVATSGGGSIDSAGKLSSTTTGHVNHLQTTSLTVPDEINFLSNKIQLIGFSNSDLVEFPSLAVPGSDSDGNGSITPLICFGQFAADPHTGRGLPLDPTLSQLFQRAVDVLIFPYDPPPSLAVLLSSLIHPPSMLQEIDQVGCS
jgi:hypothetical protein